MAYFCTKTCQLIPNQWNFTSATLNDIRFVFYHDIKDNKRNLCQDLLTIENTDSDLKVHALDFANDLLVRVRLNMQKRYEKMFGKRVIGAHSLSIRVQTTINHISISFLSQYQRQKKNFVFIQSARRTPAVKGIARHIDASGVVWLRPSNF